MNNNSSENVGCALIILLLIAVLLISIIYRTVVNIADIETGEKLGFRQYCNNIFSLHVDEPIEIDKEAKVYADLDSLINSDQSGYIDTLQKDTIVLSKGDVSLDYVDIHAVMYYKNKTAYWGYINDNSIDKIASVPTTKTINDCIEKHVQKEWIKNGKISYTTDNLKMQSIADSKQYKIVYENEHSMLYCLEKDYDSYISEVESEQENTPYILFQNGFYNIWNNKTRGVDFEYYSTEF